jgi:hypothetical protein
MIGIVNSEKRPTEIIIIINKSFEKMSKYINKASMTMHISATSISIIDNILSIYCFLLDKSPLSFLY